MVMSFACVLAKRPRLMTAGGSLFQHRRILDSARGTIIKDDYSSRSAKNLLGFRLAVDPDVDGHGNGIDGLWDAAVVVNKVEVPFRFEIAHNGT